MLEPVPAAPEFGDTKSLLLISHLCRKWQQSWQRSGEKIYLLIVLR